MPSVPPDASGASTRSSAPATKNGADPRRSRRPFPFAGKTNLALVENEVQDLGLPGPAFTHHGLGFVSEECLLPRRLIAIERVRTGSFLSRMILTIPRVGAAQKRRDRLKPVGSTPTAKNSQRRNRVLSAQRDGAAGQNCAGDGILKGRRDGSDRRQRRLIFVGIRPGALLRTSRRRCPEAR